MNGWQGQSDPDATKIDLFSTQFLLSFDFKVEHTDVLEHKTGVNNANKL